MVIHSPDGAAANNWWVPLWLHVNQYIIDYATKWQDECVLGYFLLFTKRQNKKYIHCGHVLPCIQTTGTWHLSSYPGITLPAFTKGRTRYLLCQDAVLLSCICKFWWFPIYFRHATWILPRESNIPFWFVKNVAEQWEIIISIML